jgi:hypothetical protein
MASFAKLLGIRQGTRKKYKNLGLEKFQLPILRIDTIFRNGRIPQINMNIKSNNFKVKYQAPPPTCQRKLHTKKNPQKITQTHPIKFRTNHAKIHHSIQQISS